MVGRVRYEVQKLRFRAAGEVSTQEHDGIEVSEEIFSGEKSRQS